MSVLSAYRLMWLMTLFDLPTTSKAERREANQFREYLLDLGFERAQFSVYMRMVNGKEQADTYYKKIRERLPEGGRVDIVTLTDKQYEHIISYVSRSRRKLKNPKQFALF